MEATSLTHLDISNNPQLLLDGEGVDLLLEMPELQYLALGGTRAMLRSLLLLASACPELHIDYPDVELGPAEDE